MHPLVDAVSLSPPLQAPQLSLLHYNDLRHLADVLLALPACFGPELTPLLLLHQQQQQGANGLQTAPSSSSALSGVGEGGPLPAAAAAVGAGGGQHQRGANLFLEDALLLRQAAEEVLQHQVGRREEGRGEVGGGGEGQCCSTR